MAEEKPKATNGAGKKILIIEDEKPLAHALQLKFKNQGYEVTLAEDGQKGLEIAKGGKFSAILLDLIMPNMDGFTFLEQLGDKSKKTPIIVLSNLSQSEDKGRAESMGVIGYFVKSNTPIAKIISSVQSAI